MSKKDMAIGVFDSGLGGISVLKELQKQLPFENYIYFGDSAYAPYGVKTKEEIRKRCFFIVEELLKKGIKALVIACNTATSACVKELREAFPDLIIVGMEPALKLAVQHGAKSIVVMATDFTLKEEKFEKLMACYNEDHDIIKLPSPRLVEIVEQGALDKEEIVEKQLHEYLDVYWDKKINSIVLGCTHFVFYKKQIQKLVGKEVEVVDGNEGTARHVKELLRAKAELKEASQKGEILFLNSSKDPRYFPLCHQLLMLY